MLIFQLSFCLSTLLMYFGMKKIKYKYFNKVLISASLLIPILISTFIDSNTMKDRSLYGITWFYKIQMGYLNGWNFNFMNHFGLERGYLWVNYLSNMFSSNIYFFWFLISLLTILPIFFSLYLLKDKLNICLSWWIYLNIGFMNWLIYVRQSLAIAFFSLVVALLVKKKFIPACILFIIIVIINFHQTAGVFGLMILLYLLDRKKSFFPQILVNLINISIVSLLAIKNSQTYIEKYGMTLPSNHVDVISLLIYISLITLLYFSGLSVSNKYRFIENSSILVFLFVFLGSYISIFSRFAQYFIVTFYIGIPLNIYNNKTLKKHKYFVLFVYIFIFFVGFLIYRKDPGNFLPFSVDIQDIKSKFN